MARRKKYYSRPKSKWLDEASIVHSKVLKIDVQNLEINGKYKTVFYCPSYLEPEGRMCVVWGRTTFKVGDEIHMTGRFSDGVFLVWSLNYIPCKENISNEEQAK